MRLHARTTVLLFIFFQALYALTSSGNAFRVPDEFEVYFQVEHLVDAGDLSVPQAPTIRARNGDSIFFGKFGVDRRPLEDQGLGDLGPGARTVYYERITPPPGRAWNRYRLDYLPFVSAAMRSPGWLHAPRLGEGPDFFSLHLLQARRQLPNGQAIPRWLIWALPAFWLAVLATTAAAMTRR